MDAGADVPFSCKGGVCCVCKAKVIEGEVTPTVTSPSGEVDTFSNVDSKWEYTAKEPGVHTFKFYSIDESVIEYSVIHVSFDENALA